MDYMSKAHLPCNHTFIDEENKLEITHKLIGSTSIDLWLDIVIGWNRFYDRQKSMGININELETNEAGENKGPIDKNRAEELFQTVQGLKGMAIQLTRNPQQAEDLLGDVTLKLLTKRDVYTEQWNLKGRIGRAIFRTFLDGKRKNQTVSLEDIPNPPNLSIGWGEISWPQHESYRDFQEVSEKIAGLSPTIRDPFTLYIDGVSYDQIPQELGDPDRMQNTVRSQIHKARMKVRNAFPDLYKKYAPNPKGWKKQ